MGTADQPVPSVTRSVARRRSTRVVGGLVVCGLAGAGWVANKSATRSATPAPSAASVKTAVDKAIVASEKKAQAKPALSALAFQRVVPSIVFIRTDEPAGKPLDLTDLAPPDSSPPSGSESTIGIPDTVATQDTATLDTATQDTATRDAAPPSTAPSDTASLDTAPSEKSKSRSKNPEGENGGLGTGVIINAEGAILTANHVVEGAKLIRVTFIDGTTSNATVISSEPDRDIAVLKADQNPEVVVPAVMGDGVRVGDEAFAIGHPLGLIDSMSSGVISGLNRSIPVGDDQTLDGLIQFDTAVNPGNSGGPLLNRAGQVVGIVTALANPSEQGVFIGIGFAVPIGSAAGVAGAGPGGPPR
jgi:S1-C subfamily serine protease